MATGDSCRDSSAFAKPQNDKLCYPQGKPTHNKHLQGNYFAIPSIVKKTQPESPATPSFCHSEGARSATEESPQESLKSTTSDSGRDSSVITTPSE
ncbi:hypothetical protein [Helicobacter marmotae]|uniref:hypothetical protein n=1 Tax=Helicobacter marmotae TaxID=152490 RepID=UPI000E1ECABC|nr:hypothetical protein [Helicobacter marmotae]